MLSNFGWGEIAVILVLGLFVFGPERLPRVIADGVRLFRKLRAQATSITDDLKAELQPHLEAADLRRDVDGLRDDLDDLDPRAPVRDRARGGDGRSPGGSTAVRSAPPHAARLDAGEVPPYDPDAT